MALSHHATISALLFDAGQLLADARLLSEVWDVLTPEERQELHTVYAHVALLRRRIRPIPFPPPP